jgi:predicted Zn-dependent peptidase
MSDDFKFYAEYICEPDENQVIGFQLSNGLQVLLMKRHATPIVALDIWYNVGSKDEKPGKSGFAHLFEHMMFQGSENVGKAEHMKLINDIGGMVNGSTSQDRTNYWEVIPSNQLELALWLEADRMRSLKVNQDNFENQRATVKEERKLRIDNQPYMTVLYELKDNIAYTNYAYEHSVIGSMEDLDNASLQDVLLFHETYYKPNNAVMAIVGDMQVRETIKLLAKYFEDIPAGSDTPTVNLQEPPQKKLKSMAYKDKFAPFPAYLVSFHIPERTHADFYCLQLLEKILFDGESSRFYRQLVEEKQVALHVFGGMDGKLGPSLFFLFAQLHPSKKVSDLEEAINTGFKKLKEGMVSNQELLKAKNKLRAEHIAHQQTIRTLADIFCMYTTVFKDPNQFFNEFAKYNSITTDNLRTTAQKYFTTDNSSVIGVQPYNDR